MSVAMSNRATRRKSHRHAKARKRSGHPAKKDPRNIAANEAEAFEVREIVRLVKAEATANPAEKALVGPLAAAAKRAAELLCDRDPEFDSEEHRCAVANYLTERLGAVLDEFDAEDYRAWREACVPSTLAR